MVGIRVNHSCFRIRFGHLFILSFISFEYCLEGGDTPWNLRNCLLIVRDKNATPSKFMTAITEKGFRFFFLLKFNILLFKENILRHNKKVTKSMASLFLLREHGK